MFKATFAQIFCLIIGMVHGFMGDKVQSSVWLASSLVIYAFNKEKL